MNKNNTQVRLLSGAPSEDLEKAKAAQRNAQPALPIEPQLFYQTMQQFSAWGGVIQ
ncbi:MAG: hypothetical protein RSD27_08190 [Ruthenibacterium sp.]